jgi:hypothetical protein
VSDLGAEDLAHPFKPPLTRPHALVLSIPYQVVPWGRGHVLLVICYNICTTSITVHYVASGVQGGLGVVPLKKNPQETCHIFTSIFVSIVGWFFNTWFLPTVFYF